MEELTLELDEEIVAWLEATAAAQKKSVPEIIREMIDEMRLPPRTMEGSPP